MKKLVAFLAIGLLVCTSAFAIVYNWNDGDRTEQLKAAFSTGSNGHTHDGTNSARLATQTNVVATASVTAPMFKLNGTVSTSRPASGATAGSIVAITNANGTNCGSTAAGGVGTTYVVCVSDGTNWIAL